MDTNKTGLWRVISQGSLVKQILVGLIAGILLAWLWPSAAKNVGLLGDLFVSALKAVAPVLVWVLVMASIANHRQGQKTSIRPILVLYILGTFFAAVVAVIGSFMFPSNLILAMGDTQLTPPGNIAEVLKGLLINIFANPVDALIKGNYIGILAWAIGLGIALRHANESTKTMIHDFSLSVTQLVRVVIRLAPLGIFG